MVYDDAENLYAEVRKVGGELLDEAFNVLFPRSVPLSQKMAFKTSSNSGDNVIAFNTTPFPRTDVVVIPPTGSAPQLNSKVIQTSRDGKIGYAIMHSPEGGSLCTFVAGPTAVLMNGSPCGFIAGPTGVLLPVSGVFSL